MFLQDIDLIPECPSFVAACIIHATRLSFDPARATAAADWGERLWAFTGMVAIWQHCPQVRAVRVQDVLPAAPQEVRGNPGRAGGGWAATPTIIRRLDHVQVGNLNRCTR